MKTIVKIMSIRNMKEVKKFIGTVSQPMSGLFFEPAIGCDIQVGGAHQLFVKLGYYCQSTQYFHRRLRMIGLMPLAILLDSPAS